MQSFFFSFLGEKEKERRKSRKKEIAKERETLVIRPPLIRSLIGSYYGHYHHFYYYSDYECTVARVETFRASSSDECKEGAGRAGSCRGFQGSGPR